jgi:hypothetical protein
MSIIAGRRVSYCWLLQLESPVTFPDREQLRWPSSDRWSHLSGIQGMKKFLLGMLGVISGSIAIQGDCAHATPFQGDSVYQTGDNRGGFIVVTGQPNTVAEVMGTDDSVKNDDLQRANGCGVGRVRLPDTGSPRLFIDGRGEIDWNSLPQISDYECNSRFYLGANSYNPANRTVYLINFEPQQEFVSRIRRLSIKRANINNCGFGLIYMKYGDGDFFFQGQSYRYSQLKRTVRPPVCRRIGDRWVTFFAVPLGQ